MIRSDTQRSISRTRLVGAAVLLFVFFLPLHIHSLASAKLAQECACVQGTRTQLAPISSQSVQAPIITARPILLEITFPVFVEHFDLQHVRAPPDSLSV